MGGVKENIVFGIKKILKLYPLHLVTLAIAIPLTVYQLRYAEIGFGQYFLEAIANMLLIQSWVPFHDFFFSYNGVSWYLSTILFMYMCFPLLLKRIRLIKKKSDFWLLLCITWGVELYLGILLIGVNVGKIGDEYFTYILPLYRCLDFFAGCILGAIYTIYILEEGKLRISEIPKVKGISLIECCIVIIELFFIMYIKKIPLRLGEALLMPFSVGFIYVFAINQGILSKLLTNKFLYYIGEISPYGFLIHQLVIRFISCFGEWTDDMLIFNVVISFVITILLSKSWIAIELRKASHA